MSFQPDPFVAEGNVIDGVTVTGVPAVGNVITATGATTASWQAPAGGGGSSELWISGANFAGNASGFGSPGGAGNLASFNFTAGVNRYGLTEIAIPTGWLTFSITYYLSSSDANNAHHFVFESTYQLVNAGTVFNPAVAHTQSFLNAGGADALTIALASTNISVGVAKIFTYKVVSNNASQEINTEVRLLGLLLTKLT